MRPCSLHTLLPVNSKSICKNACKFDYAQAADAKHFCINYLECCKLAEQPYRVTRKANVVIRSFRDNLQEVVVYNTAFDVISEAGNLDAPKRKFVRIGDMIIPIKSETGVTELVDSAKQSANRAFNKILDFVLANDWTHFLTLTFDQAIIGNRYDYAALKKCWSAFRQYCQSKDPNVKLLAIPEGHQDGALHFHALMYTDYAFLLRPYLEQGVPQYTKCGDVLFEFPDWQYGRATCAILPPISTGDNVRAGYYLTKYVTKKDDQGYNKKRYFRTYNLNVATKMCCEMSDIESATVMAHANMQLVKVFKGGKVYRNY